MQKKNEICREYVKKNPDYSRLKLARIIYSENNLLFSNVEAVRSVLRAIAGKNGVSNKKTLLDKSMIEIEDRTKTPYNLPKSEETTYTPYQLKANKLLLLSDIHIPYHSIQALTAVFDFAKKEKPDAILLNGDTLDFHGLSKFCKDPRKRHFADELADFKEFIQILKKTFPYAKLYFKLGNHEERYQHYLWMKAKELVGVEEFELEQIIQSRANGITVIGEKRIIKFYGLNIIHGHEFSTGFFSPVNVARGLYLRGKTSAIQGHNHQTSEHTEPDMNGKITTTWSTGCLCELHPDWQPINKWGHGFAIVDKTKEGFSVRNFRIMKGKIL